jgi:hypothetical protein
MSRLLRLARRRIRAAVVEPPPPDASINAALSGSTWYLQRSASTTRTVTLTRTSYTEPVTIAITGLPSGVTATITPSTLTGSTLVATIQLSASSGAALATTAITVTLSGSGVGTVELYGSVIVAVAPTYGPGPNAPDWGDKTVYPEELFLTPIPVHYAGENSAGFKGFQGFDGAWNEGDGGAVYTPQRVTYPTVSTPLGVKPVLQVAYPGSSSAISAINGTSSSWSARNDYGVRVTGTWSGSLVFERSLDGGTTWNPVPLRGTRGGGGAIPPSGSSTTVNGVWVTDSDYTTQLSATGIFRVRATSWGSGTATIAIGMRGGEAAARFSAGDFSGRPTRVYTRILISNSPDWSDGSNTGTKGFFYQFEEGRGHYTGLFGDAGIAPFSGLQFQAATSGVNRNMEGGVGAAKGAWGDIEFVFIANTRGTANGILKSWVNGVPLLTVTDVNFFQAEALLYGFTQFFMDPTYGGGEAPPDNPNIYIRIAGWYRESAP